MVGRTEGDEGRTTGSEGGGELVGAPADGAEPGGRARRLAERVSRLETELAARRTELSPTPRRTRRLSGQRGSISLRANACPTTGPTATVELARGALDPTPLLPHYGRSCPPPSGRWPPPPACTPPEPPPPPACTPPEPPRAARRPPSEPPPPIRTRRPPSSPTSSGSPSVSPGSNANSSINAAVSFGFSTFGEWPAPSTVATRAPVTAWYAAWDSSGSQIWSSAPKIESSGIASGREPVVERLLVGVVLGRRRRSRRSW